MNKFRSVLPVSVVVSLGAVVASACGSFSGDTSGDTTGVAGSSSTGNGGAGNTTGSGGSGNDTATSGGSTSIAGTSAVGGGTSCTGTMQSCSGSCVDTMSNSANCGMCGKACGAGLVCSNGECTATCGTGTTACSGACVDLMASAANCGMCGKACATGEICSSGACACGSDQTSCSGTCTNTMTDAANCGACGKACSTGQTCTGGTCSGGQAPTVCDVLAAAGQPCVAAHSTTRVLYTGYTGPLYQVCKGSSVAGPNSCTSGMTKDIGTVNGYADAASQDSFCSGGTCTISIVYDQTPKKNDLKPAPAGGAKNTPDNPASANALPTTLSGHSVYGILIKPGMGYRRLVANGTATGDEPETEYMVSGQKDLVNGCCFDYGNAETDAHDDGNGTMEAVYLGLGVVWGTGVNGGPWVEADLENGLYAGWENNQDRNISTNTPLKYDFITAVVIGDTKDKNGGKGRFALYGGDATTGMLKTMYDGIRPAKPGYVPMLKQGSIILGIGGDNSDGDGGRFYEGVMASGAATAATVNALQANIVAAGYGK